MADLSVRPLLNLYRWLRLAIGAALLCLAATADAADSETRHVVKDAYYGAGLFDFFEERYFSALTGLMASQQFGRVSHHVDEAELLRGGLLLSYGVHREAGEIFTRLIDKNAAPSVRNQAWFYLAKIRYQRGYLAAAEEAIGRIKGTLPADMDDERRLLHANLLMARGDYGGAIDALKDMPSDSTSAMYGRYNLGVALVKSGDAARGNALLDVVGQTPAESEEYLSLRDKANVALGYSALKDNAPEKAREYLERVRLSGLLANKALLGFGWAEATLKRPREALVPWMELTKRDASDAAVLEAKLAVPYALGEIGAYAESLRQYEEGVAVFDQENISLDESITLIRSGKMLDDLLALNPGDEMGWFWRIANLPDIPHSGHLEQVLAQHEFQEAFKNYRDLRFLARNLREWQNSLDTFRDMLANRRQAFAQRLPSVEGQRQAAAVAEMTERRGKLAAELSNAEANMQAEAFADARERNLAARIEQVRRMLAANAADTSLEEARDRQRRVAGALTWQLGLEFTERLWAAQSALSGTDSGLAEVQRRAASLTQAQRDEPQHFDAFAARIDALAERIRELTPRVAKMISAQQEVVQEIAVAELLRQKERLDTYATQARFAVAQIYDRASRAAAANKESGHAPAPAPAPPAQ